MARPRKPTKILELSGAFQKDPQRKRRNEPIPDTELGCAPEGLSESEKKAWAEIVEMCVTGVLTGADRAHVEIASCLLAEYRDKKEIRTATLLEKYLSKMGLNPSDRSRVYLADRPKEKSKWEIK